MYDQTEEIKDALAKISDSVGTPITELKAKTSELQTRLLEVEQQLVARRFAGSGPGVTGGIWGGYGSAGLAGGGVGNSALTDFVKADEGFLMLKSGKIKATQLTLPMGSIHQSKAALISAPGLAMPDRRPGVVFPALRRLTIRNLLTTATTTAGSIEFLVETLFTPGAAVVAEGATKPEAVFDLALQTAPIITIAVTVPASKQILADNAALERYLETRLRHDVQIVEELQLLTGSGVGNNLKGLAVGAVPYVAPFTFATPTLIDTVRLAIDQLENAGYECTGIVLSPDDLTKIELTKDTTGAYIKVDPSANNARTLWGKPVVATVVQTTGNFLLGDFSMVGTLYDREQPTLEIGTANDDFLRNILRLRLETRVSLTIERPGAMIKGTF